METTDLIAVSGDTYPLISATAAAHQRRDDLLATARRGTTVRDADSAERAAAVLRDCKDFTRAIEEARKAVKEAPLKLCKEIDALADSLTSQVDREAGRLALLLGTWQKEQRRLADEAARAAREREAQLVREAEEKARAEADKLRAEREALAAQAAQATTAAQAEAVMAQAEALEAKAAEASAAHVAEVEQKIVETRVAAAGKLPPAPAGIAARNEIKFEVTDIVALYEAAPFLVLLTPNTAALKAAIKGLTAGQSLPGVRHWTEARAIVS